jgi:hypothetical protein
MILKRQTLRSVGSFCEIPRVQTAAHLLHAFATMPLILAGQGRQLGLGSQQENCANNDAVR